MLVTGVTFVWQPREDGRLLQPSASSTDRKEGGGGEEEEVVVVGGGVGVGGARLTAAEGAGLPVVDEEEQQC